MSIKDQGGELLEPVIHYLFVLHCCGARASHPRFVPDSLTCKECGETVTSEGWEVCGTTQKYDNVKKWICGKRCR